MDLALKGTCCPDIAVLLKDFGYGIIAYADLLFVKIPFAASFVRNEMPVGYQNEKFDCPSSFFSSFSFSFSFFSSLSSKCKT